MKYIVLQKAKPYTRTKKGKLEHVRGYSGRPKTFTAGDVFTTPLAKRMELNQALDGMVRKNNLKAVQLEALRQDFFGHQKPFVSLFELNRRYRMVSTELDRLGKKVKIDGRGKLGIKVVKLEGKSAAFDPLEVTIELGLKKGESLAHEYAHFMYNQAVSYQKERRLEGSIDNFLIPIWKSGSDEDWKNGCKEGLAELTERSINYNRVVFSKDEIEEEEPFFELIRNIINYYAVNPELREKKVSYYIESFRTGSGRLWMTYIFDPTEIVARAISTYILETTKSHTPLLGKLETTDEYKKICNDWGKKYLETGLVKSVKGGKRYL